MAFSCTVVSTSPALQILGLDRLDGQRCVDGGLEQQLQAVLAQVTPEPPDLRGVARQAVFVVVLAAEELPQHVLAPALADLLVAQVEAVLEVQQAGHQAKRQPGATGVAGALALQYLCRAEHVASFEDLAGALLTLELGRQRDFDLCPRQPSRQHRQRIVQVDHRVNARAEEVGRLHPRIPQKSCSVGAEFEGNHQQDSGRKASIHAGCRRSAGPTIS